MLNRIKFHAVIRCDYVLFVIKKASKARCVIIDVPVNDD